ncbi:hypothetical protein SORBI_3003G071800 [Sorghum bicolor]|uniref:Secreted protein n=1 Tax=Sorghum bicolor TaxID=4558 RepID=A0A1B6Q1U4_SORBI|nr:hypothetical protein SORBI_3003G071800 [Sorghum bicolor]
MHGCPYSPCALLWWPFLWSSSFGALLLHPRCGQICWRGCTNGDEYLCFFVPSDSPPYAQIPDGQAHLYPLHRPIPPPHTPC